MSEPVLQPLIPTEQLGQLRSDGGMPTAAIDTAPVGLLEPFGTNRNTMSLNAEAKNSAETLKFNQDATGVLAQFQKDSKALTGFWPHALAVMAALNGNFGPGIQLEEQKRKTKVGALLTPALAKANEIANSGRLKESAELLQTVAANIADRMPEAAKILQPAIERLQAKQWNFEKAKVWYNIQDKSVPKEHPSRPILDQIGIAIKSGMPFAMDMVQELMGKTNTTIQEGITYTTNENTGLTNATANKAFFDKKDLGGTVGQRLAAETGLAENQIVNAMRTGEPAVNPTTGQVYTQQQLQQRITEFQGKQATIDIRSKVPTSPELAAALETQGYSKQDQAEGKYPTSAVEKGIAYTALKGAELAGAVRRQALGLPASQADKPGYVVDTETGQYYPGMSIDDGLKDKSKSLLNEKQYEESKDLYNLRNILREGRAAISKLPDINATLSRTQAFGERALDAYIGSDVQLINERVVRTVMKSALEEYINKKGVSAIRYRDALAPLTENYASKQGGEAVVNTILGRVQNDLDLIVKQGRADDTAQSSTGSQSTFERAILATEGTPDGRTSNKGAMSEYQILLSTAEPYLKQLNLPQTAVALKANGKRVFDLLAADLERKHPGRYDLQAAEYFSGPGNVRDGKVVDWTKSDGNLTVRQYVDRVMKRMGDQTTVAALPSVARQQSPVSRLANIIAPRAAFTAPIPQQLSYEEGTARFNAEQSVAEPLAAAPIQKQTTPGIIPGTLR